MGKKKNGRQHQMVSLSDEDTNTEAVHKKLCLEIGNSYVFHIKDSFGDGMCCVEGEGWYKLSVNDIIIKERRRMVGRRRMEERRRTEERRRMEERRRTEERRRMVERRRTEERRRMVERRRTEER